MQPRLLIILILAIATSSGNAGGTKTLQEPYGSSEFHVLDGLNKIESMKVVFDFNFSDPKGVARALHPVSYMLKTVQNYGPVSFEPVDIIVVSHGSEVVVWAKQNYAQYKSIIDRAARLADIGVKFEVCIVAADALGYKPEDFHGFVRVVPLGSYALAYHHSQGYAIIPGAATTPGPIINPDNKPYLRKREIMDHN